MSCKTEEKEIDGKIISVTQYPGREAFKIKVKLLKMVMPSISSLFSGGSMKDISGILDGDISEKMIGDVVKTLALSLDEDSTLDFIIRILAMSRIDDRELNARLFDDIFSGDLMFLYKILGFVLKVNYGSFFDGIDFDGIMKKIPEQPKKSQNE